MTRTPLESQDQILYPPLPTLSTIPRLSCAKLHTVQNTQTLQQFLSPLYISLEINDSMMLHTLHCKKSRNTSPSQLGSNRKLHKPILCQMALAPHTENAHPVETIQCR